jgi:hypothetical protein
MLGAGTLNFSVYWMKARLSAHENRILKGSKPADLILAVILQPPRLLLQRGDRLRSELGPIGFKEHPIADIDDEILLASRLRRADGPGGIGGPGAGRSRKRQGQGTNEPCAAHGRHENGRHSGASIVASLLDRPLV